MGSITKMIVMQLALKKIRIMKKIIFFLKRTKPQRAAKSNDRSEAMQIAFSLSVIMQITLPRRTELNFW